MFKKQRIKEKSYRIYNAAKDTSNMDIISRITNAMILCRGTFELYLFSITDCLSPSDEQHGDRQAGYSPGILQQAECHRNQHE